MENLQQLENEIKYFEILDAGLLSLKCFLNGEEIDYKAYVKNSYMLDRELTSLINAPKLIVQFMYAMQLRQLMIALRERKDYINFENITTSEKYQSLLKDIFGENSDIPTSEANKVLTEICNRICHGEIYEFFNFEKYKIFLRNSTKHEKHYYTSPVSDFIYSHIVVKDINDYLKLQSKYTSRYKMENGKKVARDKPETITITIDYKKLDKLIALVMTNYFKEIEPSTNKNDVVLQFNLNGILPMPANVSLSGDKYQNEDFEKIRNHYLSIESLNPEYAEIAALFGASLNPIFKVVTLSNLYIFLPEIFKVSTPDEIIPQIVGSSKNKWMDDMNANITAYNFEKSNLYKEFLLTELILLLTNLENKKLYPELANTKFIKLLASEIFGVEETKITEKQTIKIIKTIRNSLIHGRYINGIDTIDFYDEKPKKLCKNSAEKIEKEHLEKELEFQFDLVVDELEKIKDLCLRTLIDNYKKELNQTKNQ